MASTSGRPSEHISELRPPSPSTPQTAGCLSAVLHLYALRKQNCQLSWAGCHVLELALGKSGKIIFCNRYIVILMKVSSRIYQKLSFDFRYSHWRIFRQHDDIPVASRFFSCQWVKMFSKDLSVRIMMLKYMLKSGVHLTLLFKIELPENLT